MLYADTFLPPPHFTYSQVTDIASSLEVSKQQAKEELDRYVKEHVPAGIDVETVVAEDLPVSAILDAAERPLAAAAPITTNVTAQPLCLPPGFDPAAQRGKPIRLRLEIERV